MRWVLRGVKIVFILSSVVLMLQTQLAHLDISPEAEREDLSQVLSQSALTDADFELIFAQTGLGKSLVEEYFSAGENEKILGYQDAFLADYAVECASIIGYLTCGDTLTEGAAPDFADLRAGDILLTFSTHTAGWRHGHIALVIDENSVVESTAIGDISAWHDLSNWKACADFYVLRVVDVDDETAQKVADFATENLVNIPYGLLCDIFDDKTHKEADFTAHCAYLIWYAWNEHGINLDGNDGVIVLPKDFLESEKLEVVQYFKAR